MITLMKLTYLMQPKEIKNRLENLWEKYISILENELSSWEEINEARAILFLTGHLYCEQIAIEAIERRLHLLKEKILLNEFLNLIDSQSEKLPKLREDALFTTLEEFYNIIKSFKNKYTSGKYYLAEEHLIKRLNEKNPDKKYKIGYKGGFQEKDLSFMD